MTCEATRRELARVVADLTRKAGEIERHAAEFLDLMPERPLLLVRGEMAHWERLAQDAAELAERHRDLLTKYRRAVLEHDSPPRTDVER